MFLQYVSLSVFLGTSSVGVFLETCSVYIHNAFFLNSLFIPNNLLFLKFQVHCLWLQHTLRIFICISDFSHAIPLSTSIPCYSLLLCQCKQTQLSSENLFPHHQLAPPTGWVKSLSAAIGALCIAITTSRLSVVGRVPLWSSGLVTLPEHSPMYCTVT